MDDAPAGSAPSNAGSARFVQAPPEAAGEPVLVDARGHRCPVPTLRLQKALDACPPGGRVRLLADDPLARIDVPHFLAGRGCRLIDQAEDAGTLSFLVETPA